MMELDRLPCQYVCDLISVKIAPIIMKILHLYDFLGLHLLWALTFWPENVISISLASVHMWPNFGRMCSISYNDIVFTRFFGSLSAVTLNFDLLIPKSNEYIYEPKYVCDPGVKK